MKKLIYYIEILVCTSIFVSSCIKEDLSNCPSEVAYQFVLVPEVGNTISNSDLYSGQVYVFDEQHRLVATYQIPGRPELNKPYTPNWGLPSGIYSYVAWLNDDQNFQVDPCIIGQSVQSQTLLQYLVPQTRVVDNTETIPFLCYGHLDNRALDSTLNNITMIPIMQYTNKINLTVNGLSNTSGSNYTVSIRDNNESYGFDGAFASDDFFTYSTTKQANADILNASLNVLRLSKDRPNATLTITNNDTGETYSLGLIQAILAGNPNNDFDKTHVYNITIDNPFSNEKEVPVRITINDWILDQYNNDLNIN